MTDPKRHSELVEVAASATQVPSYAITKKDGTVTEIKVPDGAKIEVDGKPVTVATKSPLAGWSVMMRRLSMTPGTTWCSSPAYKPDVDRPETPADGRRAGAFERDPLFADQVEGDLRQRFAVLLGGAEASAFDQHDSQRGPL